MSLRVRYSVFGVALAGFAALLLWGVAGLPDFGHYRGPYGNVLIQVAVAERHATNIVAAVTWDYRGLDTMGEELILFAAAIGTTLLLRDAREEEADRREDVARADSLRLVGLGLVGATVVLGLYVVAHGVVTPGGGFQGGVVLAAALALVFLAGGYKTYRSVSPTPLVDFGEGLAIVWYVGLGLATLGVGAQFLENVLPLGTAGTLASSGTIIVLAVASGLAVAAGFVLLFTEFLEEYMLDAHRGDG